MEFIQKGFILTSFLNHKIAVPTQINYSLQKRAAAWHSLVTLLSLSSQWLLLKIPMYNAQLRPFVWVLWSTTLCYVAFLGCTSLFRHWGPLSCCAGPYHQCANEQSIGLQFQLYARSSTQGSLLHISSKYWSYRRCWVPHRRTYRVNILEFLPRDKWFVLRNRCWEGRKKKKALFYYSEVHFNLHKRQCVCDGLHEEKHYSPASSARKKNKGDTGRIKNNLLQCRILIRGPWCFQSKSRWSSEYWKREGAWPRVRAGWMHRLKEKSWSYSPVSSCYHHRSSFMKDHVPS